MRKSRALLLGGGLILGLASCQFEEVTPYSTGGEEAPTAQTSTGGTEGGTSKEDDN